ncbi:hypothetical protein C7C46_07925 [Streptomyces tateyamensis]|uniref:RDD family protein n=1 Tax=Streptomyces tateyamensis TaxID=565073 RepID=A0A2V4P3S8_9ACTN|nr:RDD family protein [Streptomyces tateyamensis]PYC84403.1 hypothetical protein C7C46_07925 [Streptomyces tateyamensis]
MPDQPLPTGHTAVVPEPGYYPDPSVPGFVRYWNGTAWVPGTSRPAPAAGEVLVAPRFAARAAQAAAAGRYIPPPVAVVPQSAPAPEPTPARLVAAGPETGPVFLDETGAGAVLIRGEECGVGAGWADPRAQPGLLEPGEVSRVSWGSPEPVPMPGPGSAPGPAEAVPAPSAAAAPPDGVVAPEAVARAAAVAPLEVAAPPKATPAPVVATRPAPVPARRPAAHSRSAAHSRPSRSPEPSRSARLPQPARAARRPAAPAAVRAGLGRRALARLVDTVLLAAVVAAVAVPVVSATDSYLQRKLDQARTASHLTGREVQVWLVDGTVLGRAGLLLGTVLLAGLLLEVLPTARAGRTLGKRLAGVRVAAVDDQRAPGFGRSLVRWLLGQLLVLTVIGIPALVSWPDRVGRSRVLRG